jgi:hypothetical protein
MFVHVRAVTVWEDGVHVRVFACAYEQCLCARVRVCTGFV